ncbi:hypothetical protein CMV_019559, partial [Castanea mollissima]
MAETNPTVEDAAVQAKVDLSRIVTNINKEEGGQCSPKGCEEQDQQRQESPFVGLGQPSSGLDNVTCAGANTRTWKRLQHHPMHVGTIVSKDVEVGTKCKHKPKHGIYESTEIPEVKKMREDDEVLEVSALINLVTATWKYDIIHEVFLPFDAEAILSIPLSPSLSEDRLIWAFTPTGRFSVRSAYRVTRMAMADTHQGKLMHAVQYFGYGGGASGLK